MAIVFDTEPLDIFCFDAVVIYTHANHADVYNFNNQLIQTLSLAVVDIDYLEGIFFFLTDSAIYYSDLTSSVPSLVSSDIGTSNTYLSVKRLSDKVLFCVVNITNTQVLSTDFLFENIVSEFILDSNLKGFFKDSEYWYIANNELLKIDPSVPNASVSILPLNSHSESYYHFSPIFDKTVGVDFKFNSYNDFLSCVQFAGRIVLSVSSQLTAVYIITHDPVNVELVETKFQQLSTSITNKSRLAFDDTLIVLENDDVFFYRFIDEYITLVNNFPIVSYTLAQSAYRSLSINSSRDTLGIITGVGIRVVRFVDSQPEATIGVNLNYGTGVLAYGSWDENYLIVSSTHITIANRFRVYRLNVSTLTLITPPNPGAGVVTNFKSGQYIYAVCTDRVVVYTRLGDVFTLENTIFFDQGVVASRAYKVSETRFIVYSTSLLFTVYDIVGLDITLVCQQHCNGLAFQHIPNLDIVYNTVDHNILVYKLTPTTLDFLYPEQFPRTRSLRLAQFNYNLNKSVTVSFDKMGHSHSFTGIEPDLTTITKIPVNTSYFLYYEPHDVFGYRQATPTVYRVVDRETGDIYPYLDELGQPIDPEPTGTTNTSSFPLFSASSESYAFSGKAIQRLTNIGSGTTYVDENILYRSVDCSFYCVNEDGLYQLAYSTPGVTNTSILRLGQKHYLVNSQVMLYADNTVGLTDLTCEFSLNLLPVNSPLNGFDYGYGYSYVAGPSYNLYYYYIDSITNSFKVNHIINSGGIVYYVDNEFIFSHNSVYIKRGPQYILAFQSTLSNVAMGVYLRQGDFLYVTIRSIVNHYTWAHRFYRAHDVSLNVLAFNVYEKFLCVETATDLLIFNLIENTSWTLVKEYITDFTVISGVVCASLSTGGVLCVDLLTKASWLEPTARKILPEGLGIITNTGAQYYNQASIPLLPDYTVRSVAPALWGGLAHWDILTVADFITLICTSFSSLTVQRTVYTDSISTSNFSSEVFISLVKYISGETCNFLGSTVNVDSVLELVSGVLLGAVYIDSENDLLVLSTASQVVIYSIPQQTLFSYANLNNITCLSKTGENLFIGTSSGLLSIALQTVQTQTGDITTQFSPALSSVLSVSSISASYSKLIVLDGTTAKYFPNASINSSFNYTNALLSKVAINDDYIAVVQDNVVYKKEHPASNWVVSAQDLVGKIVLTGFHSPSKYELIQTFLTPTVIHHTRYLRMVSGKVYVYDMLNNYALVQIVEHEIAFSGVAANGNFMAVYRYPHDSPNLRIYKWVDNQYVFMAEKWGHLDAGSTGIKISPSGNNIMQTVRVSPYSMAFHQRSSDTSWSTNNTLHNTDVFGSSSISGIAWKDDNIAMLSGPRLIKRTGTSNSFHLLARIVYGTTQGFSSIGKTTWVKDKLLLNLVRTDGSNYIAVFTIPTEAIEGTLLYDCLIATPVIIAMTEGLNQTVCGILVLIDGTVQMWLYRFDGIRLERFVMFETGLVETETIGSDLIITETHIAIKTYGGLHIFETTFEYTADYTQVNHVQFGKNLFIATDKGLTCIGESVWEYREVSVEPVKTMCITPYSTYQEGGALYVTEDDILVHQNLAVSRGSTHVTEN